MTQTKTRALTEGALMVAAATALSYVVKLLELPQGGSVCIGMLPIFLYCPLGLQGDFRLLRLRPSAAHFSTALTPGARPRCCSTMCSPIGVLGVACLFRKQKGGVLHRHGRRLPVPFHRPLHQRRDHLPHL